jgi:retron-type reverse transcriptase
MVEGVDQEKAVQIWEAAKVYVDNLNLKDAEDAAREAIAKDFFSQKAEREYQSEKQGEGLEEALEDGV